MKLIINADDFGLAKSVNKAIIELAEIGIVTSTTVMVNMPFVKEVIELIKNENISVGLHINLTQGKPLSDPKLIPSLIDKNGLFFEPEELRKRLHRRMVTSEEIYIEIKKQFELLDSFIGIRLTHFDSHNDILKFSDVTKALIKLKNSIARNMAVRVYHKTFIKQNKQGIFNLEQPTISNLCKYGIKRILIEYLLKNHTKKLGTHFKHGNGFILTDSYRAFDILQLLASDFKTNSGGIYEICCHPATDTSDLPVNILMESRVNEYNLLKSKSFQSIKKNVELISYAKVS
jgi:predicted glycoside hydrolase/deacetylase ChbG (UPF0249 family)